MKIHHVGYAVRHIDEAFKYFKLLGFSIRSEVVEDNSRNIRICFIENNGIRIELIEPMNDKSPIESVLSKNGPIPYHLCIETENIIQSVSDLQKNGFMLLNPPKVDPAIENRHVAFLFRKEIGLIELVANEK
ncbi:MAG TPA: VOC family protein [Thermotogota bacterium]|nr:VOC family protein [Thermotogota bacterium]HPJ88282.1 VOC family protein [Thermotogota bacterium]HPR95371.1 VOC family protein [Thermotogota bacterium]